MYKNQYNLTARARKEFILSAGAISSPPLLMHSGIGPREHLNKFNIPTISDLPVGKNLEDHVVVNLYFEFESLNPVETKDTD